MSRWKRRCSLLGWVCAVAVTFNFSLIVGILFKPEVAYGFVLPEDPLVGAGSRWEYESNLGKATVRMLSREQIRSDVERYVWDLRVGGLRYLEELELTPDSLGVVDRELIGFGLLREHFVFLVPELVLELPLAVGREWEWTGSVERGNETREAWASGKVLGVETIDVPAGRFITYHIQISRRDEFGTTQEIDLWFDPQVGPIRAVGDLQWRGLIGVLQSMVGMRRFEVELKTFTISPPKDGPLS